MAESVAEDLLHQEINHHLIAHPSCQIYQFLFFRATTEFQWRQIHPRSHSMKSGMRCQWLQAVPHLQQLQTSNQNGVTALLAVQSFPETLEVSCSLRHIRDMSFKSPSLGSGSQHSTTLDLLGLQPSFRALTCCIHVEELHLISLIWILSCHMSNLHLFARISSKSPASTSKHCSKTCRTSAAGSSKAEQLRDP